MRIGMGCDIHALKKGRSLIVGGVNIPFELGLEGHSDGDVLLHSICDALLGAAGLGDIGKYFSDKNIAYKDMDSLILLRRSYEMILRKGFYLLNLDNIIFAQKPDFSRYKNTMTENISDTLKVDKEKINVKATSTEYLGFLGRGEGIAAMSTVLLCHSTT